MKSKSTVLASAFVLTAFIPVARADGLIVSPRAEVLHVEFSAGYSGEFDGVAFNNGYDISLQALRAGVTVASERIYLDAYYQVTNDDADTLLFGPWNYSYESERDEYVVAIGYRLSEQASLFTGYRRSEADSRAANGNTVAIDNNAYFLGASFNQIVPEKGVVSFNAAYVHIDSVDYTADNLDIPTIFKLDGDGNGWKLGALWNGRLTEKLGYTIGGDYYSYDWDASNSAGDHIDADEDELFLRAGLSYFF